MIDGAEVTVEANHVSKKFKLVHERNQSIKAAIMRGRRTISEDFWALRDVSFQVHRGETFGLIGENGSGKSTMLKCLTRILRPNEGSVRVEGKVSALLELGAGFHPELSGRENVFLNGAILGLSQKELHGRFDEIVDFAGIEQFIDEPVKNYSSGMYVRLGFSVAINVDPDVLFVDEVLAVGDEAFQRKCNEKFAELRRAGKTIVLVSHGLSGVQNLCDRVAWFSHGQLMQVGRPREVIEALEGPIAASVAVTVVMSRPGRPPPKPSAPSAAPAITPAASPFSAARPETRFWRVCASPGICSDAFSASFSIVCSGRSELGRPRAAMSR